MPTPCWRASRAGIWSPGSWARSRPAAAGRHYGATTPRAGPGLTSASALVVLVVARVVGVRVVLVVILGRRVVPVALSDEFGTQAVQVRPAAAVLQLAGDLRLLGLRSAAPHGSTPFVLGQCPVRRV